MKIGIISNYEWLKQWSNYGTLFQNFALQKSLEKLGHQSFWILTSSFDRRRPNERLRNFLLQIRHQPVALFTLILRRVLAHNSVEGKDLDIRIFNERHPRHFDHFLTHCMNTTEIEYDIKMLRNAPPDAEAYIVGSDNVWADVSPISFLDFGGREVRRIAYGVSAPWSNLSSYWNSKASAEIARIDHISVREVEGLTVCRELGRADVLHVLDPTLLIAKEDYIDLIAVSDQKVKFEEPTALGYLINVEDLSELPWKCLNSYAYNHSLNLRIVPLQGTELIIPDDYIICPTPIGWLNAFDQSECIVTNSFHGTIFSIIFRKPFVVLSKGMNGTRGGSVRFYSLLNSLGLENRIFSGSTVEEFETVMSRYIDWDIVDEKLRLMRQLSLDFLSKALS